MGAIIFILEAKISRTSHSVYNVLKIKSLSLLMETYVIQLSFRNVICNINDIDAIQFADAYKDIMHGGVW